jgi:hypothetical protein
VQSSQRWVCTVERSALSSAVLASQRATFAAACRARSAGRALSSAVLASQRATSAAACGVCSAVSQKEHVERSVRCLYLVLVVHFRSFTTRKPRVLKTLVFF